VFSTLRETLGLGVVELLAGLLSAPFIWLTIRALFGRPEKDAADLERQWPLHLFNLLPGTAIWTSLTGRTIVLALVCFIVLAFWYRVIGFVMT
jgi:hypothetical protein